MSLIRITHPTRRLHASLTLEGSKSISNRALIALTLADTDPNLWLNGISTAQDTLTLQSLLAQPSTQSYDAGDAGTAFRFLTAYLATRPGTQVLTGSARMQQRPIGPLVEALRILGADIEYMGENGFPPLRIGTLRANAGVGRSRLSVAAGTSSQYLSALLLIGPYLPGGLELVPEGRLVSRPYVDMTLHLMRYFGAEAQWQEERLLVEPGGYVPRPMRIEADWSAASYWYAMAALSESADLRLEGLFAESWQGDAAVAVLMERQFGIQTIYEADGIRLSRSIAPIRPVLEHDFLGCPDLVQTVAVLCAACGVHGLFSGLDTLTIKETDRVAALQAELRKVGVSLTRLPAHFSRKTADRTYYSLDGKAHWVPPLHVATYGDHRMALAFAPLALLAPLEVEAPQVVAKSYPRFWADWQIAGGQLEILEQG